MDDLHDLLRAGDGLEDPGAQCTLADRRDELTDDPQAHVGLKERHADIAQRFVEIGLRDARPPTEALERDRELVGELLEHQKGRRLRTRSAA